MLKAQVEVHSFEALVRPQHELEDYVRKNLAYQFVDHLAKKMNITSQHNPMTDTTTYTSSITASHFSDATIEKGEELRVVEFTKNGKVARVELQRKTQNGWRKIPRIQIEE